MPDQIYEVVSQGARYWFLFLMVLIVWRSYRWLARDRKQRKKRLKLLPDAGYVGELVVVQGNAELPEGLALPVSGEGTLGCLRGNDVYVPVKGVAKKHLWYEFDDEQGLRVEPYGRRRMEVDGKTYTGRRAHTYLTHGARLVLGDAVLRLRMFAGFEYAGIKHAVALEDELGPDVVEPSAMQPMPDQPPAGTIAFTPEQVSAFQQMQQMQWMAAWQAMQAEQCIPQAGEPAVPNTQGNALPVSQGSVPPPSSMIMTPAASAVLATATGEFLAPPKAAVSGAILSNADTATEEETEDIEGNAGSGYAAPAALQPQRHPRHHNLPPIADVDATSDGSEWAEAQNFASDAYAPENPTADELWTNSRMGDRDASLRRLPNNGLEDADDNAAFAGNTTFAPRVTFYPPVLEEESYPGESQAPDATVTDRTDETWPYATYPQSNVRFEESGYTYPEYVSPEAVDEPYEYADEDEAPRSLYVEPDEAAQAKRVLWDKYLKGGHRK